MILALLGGMREHTAQLRAGQTEFALGMLVGTLVTKLTRREGTAKKRKQVNKNQKTFLASYIRKKNYLYFEM